jgi:hypothetical protein
MKYVKTLAAIAIAVASLIAFVGAASATTITSLGTGSTPTIHGEAEGHILLHPGTESNFLSVTCGSTLEATIASHGASSTASGSISVLTFSTCSAPVTVLKKGSLEIHGTSTTGNGTLTWRGGEVRIHTSEGPVCTFKPSGTDLGTLTGDNITDATATIDVDSAPIPASGFLCPSAGLLTGEYRIEHPGTLSVH